MAVTVTDNRTIRDEADSITGWVTSPTLFTTDPDPAEATGCLGFVVSNETEDDFHTGAAIDLTGKLVYVWVLPRGAMDSKANGGYAILLGDGTNRVAYHLGGKDVSPFRPDEVSPDWKCMVLDQSNLPTQKTVRLGTEAGLSFTAITEIGAMFKTLAKSVGGVSNCFVDIMRIGDPAANNGAMLTITGGTDVAPGTFKEIVTEDRSSANQKASGVIRELGAGLFGIQGAIRFGDSTGTSASVFREKNIAIAFESRGLSTTRYKIVIVGNATGTTEFKLGTKVGTGSAATGSDAVTLITPSGVGSEFDSTNVNATTVNIYGSSFSNFSNGIKLRSANEFIGCTVSSSGTVEPNGAILVNTKIVNSTATRALLWNTASDTNTKLDGVSFSSSGTGHAIELGPNTPVSITFTGMKYTGYAAVDGSTGNEVLYNNSAKTITVNIAGGGDTPTVRNGAGASTTVVTSAVLTIKIKDADGNAVTAACEVTVVRTSDDVVLFNEENVTTGTSTYSYSSGAGSIVHINVHNVISFQNKTFSGHTLSSANETITIQLDDDRFYANP